MINIIAFLLLIFAVLTAIFRLIPINEKQQLKISYLLLISEAILAIIFRLSSRQDGIYCASLAHYHWPTVSLLTYLGLFLLAALLLQQYSRWWAISYLGLVVFPLSLGSWVIQNLCAGQAINLVSDLVQTLILLVTFPLTSIIFGGVFLVYLVYVSWRKPQLSLPSMALLGLFLLFLEHAIFDWFRFIIDF